MSRGGSRLAALVVALLCGAAASCKGDEDAAAAAHPQRSCLTTFWHKPPEGTALVSIVGSWNNWQLPGAEVPINRDYPAWRSISLRLPAGQHGYVLQRDGVGVLDDENPLTTFRGDDEVSLVIVEDCGQPALRVDDVSVTGGDVTVKATYLAADGGAPLDPARLSVPAPFALSSSSPESGAIELRASGLARGKHPFTLAARDERGREASVQSYAWVKPAAATWDEGLLYQIVVDRYRDDEGRPLAKPKTPGSRAGGTLKGVLAELRRGTFEAMGVSALWLSPVYLNPDEAREGLDGRLYEGYHGYWPIASREVDPRIGGEAALRELIDEAHGRGLRVIFDIVPNHVYERHPLYQAHRGDGWFADGASMCVCGNEACPWSTHIDRCWFTPYLPDFRWQEPAVADVNVADALFFMQAFSADGVRIDAVPMMPRAATRRIARALRDASPGADRYFVLGEVFTGPGEAGIANIRYHLGPAGLDSAFDFPLMWAMRDVIGRGQSSFADIDEVLTATDEALEGSGAVKARIIGNHDTTRFMSVAAGNDAGDPWVSPPGDPASPVPYARHRTALSLMLTLPGLPVVYYGDEVALPGRGDPDCRRVMPGDDGLGEEQRATRALVQRLGRVRACSAALRKGARKTLHVDDDTLLFTREHGDDVALVALSREASSVAGKLPAGSWVDVLSGESLEGGASAKLSLSAYEPRVLLRQGDSCLAR